MPNREELAYLQEALAVLKDSLSRESDPGEKEKLREYVGDLERRIAAAQNEF